MAKNFQVNYIERQHEIRSDLDQAGITSHDIEKFLSSYGVDKLLSDNKLLSQYFLAATRGLQYLTTPQYDDKQFRSLTGQVPKAEGYEKYFHSRDTSKQTRFQHYFPHDSLFNPKWMEENGYFTAQQSKAMKMLMTHGIFSEGDQGGESEGQTRGGTGKAMAAPGPGGKMLGGGLPGPPPPGGGYPPGGMGSLPNQPGSFTQMERQYLSNFNGSPVEGWFNMLLDRVDFSRGVGMNIISGLESLRQKKRQLHELIAGYDPRDPLQAHQIMVLTQQAQDVDGEQKMLMDKLIRVQKFKDEFTQLMKGIFDKYNENLNFIIRNIAGR